MKLLNFRILSLILLLLSVSNTHAACTIEVAQQKMLEVTNMMQVYNKQQSNYLQERGELPAEFEQRFDAFVDRSNQLGVEFANIMETQTHLRPEDKIDDGICQGYEALFADYVPDGYENKEVKVQQTTADPNCNTNALWARYADILGEQNEMVANGTFTEEESFDLQRLNMDIGQTSTTDITKACALMDELEQIVKSKR